MKLINFGSKRRGNEIVDLEDRVGRLELGLRQIPSRFFARGQAQGKPFEITKTTHGWTVGKWIVRSGSTWILADSTSDVTATGASGYVDPIGLVVKVISADKVQVVTEGLVYIPDLSFTDWTTYFLGASGDVLASSPDDPGGTTWGSKSARKIVRATHVAMEDGWIWLPGPTLREGHNHHLKNLADVALFDIAGLSGAYQALLFDPVDSLWKLGTSTSIGTRTALSVVGNPTGSAALATDIVAGADGVALQRLSGALSWAQIATGTIANGAVTAAKIGSDVVLDTLHDVTIASVAALNFLRYDAGSSQWKNYDLGPIFYTLSTTELSLDGGSGGATVVAGLGADGSRFVLAGAPAPLDFLLAGSVAAGTDKSARLQRVSSTQVSFYDQATASGGTGTEVLRWNCSSSGFSRSFEFLTQLKIGSAGMTMQGNTLTFVTDSTDATIAASASTHVMTLTGRFVSLVGEVLMTSANNVTIGNSANNTTISAGITVIGASSGQLSFFQHTAAVKQSAGTPSAIVTTETAGASYTGTEQSMLGHLKTDVTNLRSTLNTLVTALQTYGLV